jgi:CheY-like chemotaxis protein
MNFEQLSAVVADDNKSARDIVSHILRSAGVRDIRQADDGAEAFRRVCERAPDFLILDFEMPHDGVTTLRQIRTSAQSPARQLPIIMMTAYTTLGRIEAMRDSGASEVLSKPLTSAKLLSRIEAVLLRPRPFIDGPTFVGPDRRRLNLVGFAGPFRRMTDDASNVLDIA